MLVVGLTGGIGSGKSTVATRFASHGVPIIDADAISHALTQAGNPALERIAETIGSHIMTANGQLDRASLRKQVFSDPIQRQALEAIMHPLVRAEMADQLAQLRSGYCLLCIPLLFEANMTDLVNRILLVESDPTHCIQRVMQRNRLSAREVRQIMATQVSDETRRAMADDRITNNTSLYALEQQVDRLHQHYQALLQADPGKTNDPLCAE